MPSPRTRLIRLVAIAATTIGCQRRRRCRRRGRGPPELVERGWHARGGPHRPRRASPRGRRHRPQDRLMARARRSARLGRADNRARRRGAPRGFRAYTGTVSVLGVAGVRAARHRRLRRSVRGLALLALRRAGARRRAGADRRAAARRVRSRDRVDGLRLRDPAGLRAGGRRARLRCRVGGGGRGGSREPAEARLQRGAVRPLPGRRGRRDGARRRRRAGRGARPRAARRARGRRRVLRRQSRPRRRSPRRCSSRSLRSVTSSPTSASRP